MNYKWGSFFDAQKQVIKSNLFFAFLYSADWYKGILTDKQLDELENPPTTTAKPLVAKVSRRKHPSRKQQRKTEEETADTE